jgi:hypothetical protein
MPRSESSSGWPWRTGVVNWADEDSGQRRKTTLPQGVSPQERGLAAWFDGQYCSLEAFIVSLIQKRNTVQNGSSIDCGTTAPK